MSYTSAALRDIHERSHGSLAKLLAHCGEFSEDDLGRAFPGFGYATLREQFHHVIGAEAYWLGVLAGRSSYDSDETQYPTAAALEAYRESVFASTAAYLAEASDDEVNRPRACMTWGDVEATLVPAHVVMRTQTHLFQHMGQITALCRLLDRPVPPGMDYTLR